MRVKSSILDIREQLSPIGDLAEVGVVAGTHGLKPRLHLPRSVRYFDQVAGLGLSFQARQVIALPRVIQHHKIYTACTGSPHR